MSNMNGKKGIWEYEELIKARIFFIEGQRGFHDFTFEKIKKGLSSEYLDNIEEKIGRWIDITVFEHFQKVRPVEFYLLAKMLYRDGFYESAIITSRCICEMICYDLLENMSHPFGDEVELENFRVLLKFICIPKKLPENQFDMDIVNKIPQNEDRNFVKSYFTFNPNHKEYSLKFENAKSSKNLNRFFSIFSDIGFELFDKVSKENFDILNQIYNLGNTYVHSSRNLNSSKTDARKILMDTGKVLFDIYGIKSTEELKGYKMEAGYKDYPDILSGINFLIEAFVSPDDAMRGYYNIPSNQFIQKMKTTVGDWNGKWISHGILFEDAKLAFLREDIYLKATIEYSFEYGNQLTNISEKLDVRFFEGYFHLQSYEHKLEPPIDDIEYANHLFELEFLGDDILIGNQKSIFGNGKALFTRV